MCCCYERTFSWRRYGEKIGLAFAYYIKVALSIYKIFSNFLAEKEQLSVSHVRQKNLLAKLYTVYIEIQAQFFYDPTLL